MKKVIGISLYIGTGFILAAIASMSMLISSKQSDATIIKPIASENEFKEAINNKLTVVKFHAPWCGFCKRITPAYEQMAKDYPKTLLTELDCTTEHGKKVSQPYNIEGFPTFIFFKNGKKVAAVVGADEHGIRTNLSKNN